MKRILAITYCFPPIFVPATMCYVKLVKGLSEDGYNVCVFSIDPRSFSSTNSNYNKLDKDLNKIVPHRIINRTVWSFEKNVLFKILKKYNILYKLYEPFKKEWYYSAVLHAKKFKDYDIILSCSQPHSSHLVGYHLKKTMNKPWIAYFSDPWIDNPYSNYRSEKIYKYHLKLENKVICNADYVLFTTKETQDLVMRKYPAAFLNKTGIIPHSFVPEWYNLSNGKDERNNGRIKVLHTGNFYGPRTPIPLFNNLIRLKREVKNISDKIEFLFYGDMAPAYRSFICENKLNDIVEIHNTIPYITSLGLMKNADYLLLIDAPLTSTKESVFLPSKLVDYIGSYKKIIGITPDQGASAKLLKDTSNHVWDIQDEDFIYRNLKGLVDGKLIIEPKKEKIDSYHYKNIAKKLSKIIEQL
ncbi:MAG: hypothetical protein ACMUHX_11835 [bacterium]